MLDKLFGGVWGYLAMAALAIGLLAYTYHLGSASAAAEGRAKYSTLQANYAAAALTEGARQASANQDAKAAEALAIATIDTQSVALQELHRKLRDEASRDPTSTDDCLNRAARLRVNQVR